MEAVRLRNNERVTPRKHEELLPIERLVISRNRAERKAAEERELQTQMPTEKKRRASTGTIRDSSIAAGFHSVDEARNAYLNHPERRHSVHNPDLTVTTGDMIYILQLYYSTNDSEDPMFDSDYALLKRESMRFDPRIVKILNRIWVWTDLDRSGCVDKVEYVRLHIGLSRFVEHRIRTAGQTIREKTRRKRRPETAA